MTFFIVIMSGLFGFLIGSFANALIYRLRSGESMMRGRSHCTSCNRTLAWYDLVPILSFIILRGQCRYCRNSISLQYPIVELASAVLFVFIAWHATQLFNPFSESLSYIFYSFFLFFVFSGLLVIFVYDIKHYLIPDKVLFPLIVLSALWHVVSVLFVDSYDYTMLLNALGAAGAVTAFFFALFFFSRGAWMGFGDVKLVFFMGLFLGYPTIFVALFFAFTSGAIIGAVLIALQRKSLKSQVPFGPFLITGTFVAFFWGAQLVQWYLDILL